MNESERVPSMDSESTVKQINQVLASLRGYLQEDGGDVEFVHLSPEGIVEVRFLGSCASCSLAIMTLRAGIERELLLNVPGLKRIERVQ